MRLAQTQVWPAIPGWLSNKIPRAAARLSRHGEGDGMTRAYSGIAALLQDITRQPMRRLRQPVVIRPQGVAAMVLSAGEVQRIRCLQTEMGTEPRGLQVHRHGHTQRRKLVEQLSITTLQDLVATLYRPTQAVAFDQ